MENVTTRRFINIRKSNPSSNPHWVIVDAVYAGDYKVKIWFIDGATKIVDLEQVVFATTSEIFTPLQNKDFFAEVTFEEELGTITWDTGADFAPEFLYENGTDFTHT